MLTKNLMRGLMQHHVRIGFYSCGYMIKRTYGIYLPVIVKVGRDKASTQKGGFDIESAFATYLTT